MPHITSAQAAKILGISKRTLFRWEDKSKIKSIREGVLQTRMYDQNYIQQTADILEINRQYEKNLAKLPSIREKITKFVFADDVNVVRQTGEVRFMDLDKAGEAMDEEDKWLEEHKRLLNQLFSYPKDRLRELLLAKE